MKNTNLLLVVFLLFFTPGFAQSVNTEQFILDLSRKKFNWMVSLQSDSLAAILDDQLVYIHSNGWAQSKKEVLEDFIRGKLSYQSIEVVESSMRLFDKTAIVNGKGTFTGVVSGISFSLNLLYTEVYTRKGNDWLLASRHANKMP
jgi:hypothetical protein